MRKILPFFALALLTLAGCKNSFDGNTAEQKIPANANVVLTLASPERTIAPGKLSEILKSAAKTEKNWTFTFTRTDEPSVQDVLTYERAASETTAAFTLPIGTYDITAELSYTDETASITYKIEGKLTDVVVSETAVKKTINIAFKKTTGGTGTLNYTFDFSGWGQVFTEKPVLCYQLVKHGGSVADVEWRKPVKLYNDITADGSGTTDYIYEHQLNESIGSGYWDIYAKVEGYNADDTNLVYNIPINDNLVEIADGLTSTGSIVVSTPDTSKLYYVSCEEGTPYIDNNGTFEFSRVSLSKAFEKAKALKKSVTDVTFSLDELKDNSLELDASVLATGKTIHFQIASGASFVITPEGHLESASGLTSVTFYTASEKTVNVAQSFIENSYSNTPLDIILKNGVSLNCKLSENSNGVQMNLHVYGIENYLTSPVITLDSTTASCITTNTFYDAKGTDKTKDYMLSKKTTEDAGTTGGKTEYCIVPARSVTLGTETITNLSVTCVYGSEEPELTPATDVDYTYTGTAPYDYGDEITFTAKADNAASYVWSCFTDTDTYQRETLLESDTGTCIVNIKKTKAIDENGVITMLVTAVDSDGNATSYEVKFTVTPSTTTSHNILWDKDRTYYAVSNDAMTSGLSLSNQTPLPATVWDFGFYADMNLYTLESGNAAKVLNYYTSGLKRFSITSSANATNTNISKIAITSNKVYASDGSSLNEFELPLVEGSTATDVTWKVPSEDVGIKTYVFNSLAADDTNLYIGCKDKSSNSAPLYVVKYALGDLNTIAGIARLDITNLVSTVDGVDTSLTTDITDMIAQDGKLYVLAAVYHEDGGYYSKFNGNMYEIDPASITGSSVTDSITVAPAVNFYKLSVTVGDTDTTIAYPYPSKFVAVMPKKLKIAIDGGKYDTSVNTNIDEDYVVTYDIADKTATGVKFNNNMFDFYVGGPSGFYKN
ncbi:hypothetical protein [Treponema sp.]|uniref:hypothetical protein n=1 Tax=Treponema sp. TaxID=166 RepID=UPI003FD7EB45